MTLITPTEYNKVVQEAKAKRDAVAQERAAEALEKINEEIEYNAKYEGVYGKSLYKYRPNRVHHFNPFGDLKLNINETDIVIQTLKDSGWVVTKCDLDETIYVDKPEIVEDKPEIVEDKPKTVRSDNFLIKFLKILTGWRDA